MPRFQNDGVQYASVADIPHDQWSNLEELAFDASTVMSKAIALIKARRDTKTAEQKEVMAELQRCVDMFEKKDNVIQATKQALQTEIDQAQQKMDVEKTRAKRQLADPATDAVQDVESANEIVAPQDASAATISSKCRNRRGRKIASNDKKRKAPAPQEVDAEERPPKVAASSTESEDYKSPLGIPFEVFLFDDERFVKKKRTDYFSYQGRAIVEYSGSKPPLTKDLVSAAQAKISTATTEMTKYTILTYQRKDSTEPEGFKKADAFLLKLYLTQQKKKYDDESSDRTPGYEKGRVGLSIVFTKDDLEKAHAETAALKDPPLKPITIGDGWLGRPEIQ